MLPRITITRKWSDNDVAQLTFEVCDGVSVFTNEAYDSLEWGATAAAALRTFGRQIHGGLFDLVAGDGGPEYASGSFRARFHYYKPNQLLISTIQQGDFFSRRCFDVRPRKWWVGSPDVHIRFRYHDREYIVWEPWGDNSRWWIGPDDENAPHFPLDELERALSRS
jgi:hypothetical protein